MSIMSTPWMGVFDVIGKNMSVDKDLPIDEFLSKYQAWIDAFRSSLKPEDLLRYRESIRNETWWRT